MQRVRASQQSLNEYSTHQLKETKQRLASQRSQDNLARQSYLARRDYQPDVFLQTPSNPKASKVSNNFEKYSHFKPTLKVAGKENLFKNNYDFKSSMLASKADRTLRRDDLD